MYFIHKYHREVWFFVEFHQWFVIIEDKGMKNKNWWMLNVKINFWYLRVRTNASIKFHKIFEIKESNFRYYSDCNSTFISVWQNKNFSYGPVTLKFTYFKLVLIFLWVNSFNKSWKIWIFSYYSFRNFNESKCGLLLHVRVISNTLSEYIYI